MGRLVTLDEIEAYQQECYHAARENRPARYRNPHEVFAENPNAESFLVELGEQELADANELFLAKVEEDQQIADVVAASLEENNGSVALAEQVTFNEPVVPGEIDPAGPPDNQQFLEDLARVQNDTYSPHQAQQSTPSPEIPNNTVLVPGNVPETIPFPDNVVTPAGVTVTTAGENPEHTSDNLPPDAIAPGADAAQVSAENRPIGAVVTTPVNPGQAPQNNPEGAPINPAQTPEESPVTIEQPVAPDQVPTNPGDAPTNPQPEQVSQVLPVTQEPQNTTPVENAPEGQ